MKVIIGCQLLEEIWKCSAFLSVFFEVFYLVHSIVSSTKVGYIKLNIGFWTFKLGYNVILVCVLEL